MVVNIRRHEPIFHDKLLDLRSECSIFSEPGQGASELWRLEDPYDRLSPRVAVSNIILVPYAKPLTSNIGA
jgi:hypothetical protein